jgi:hypothetical protein
VQSGGGGPAPEIGHLDIGVFDHESAHVGLPPNEEAMVVGSTEIFADRQACKGVKFHCIMCFCRVWFGLVRRIMCFRIWCQVRSGHFVLCKEIYHVRTRISYERKNGWYRKTEQCNKRNGWNLRCFWDLSILS